MDMKTYQQLWQFGTHEIERGFDSDGCTGIPELGLTECCTRHDILRKSPKYTDREADDFFYECVKRRRGRVLATVLWLGVRVQSITGMSVAGLGFLLAFVAIVVGMVVLGTILQG